MHCVRSYAFRVPILSHAIGLRLWLPPATNPIEPLILGLPFASCPGWETIKAAAVLMAAVVAAEYKTNDHFVLGLPHFLSRNTGDFLQPFSGAQWTRTLFLLLYLFYFLGFLLLSDFPALRPCCFSADRNQNFSHILIKICCIKLLCGFKP